MVVDFRLGRLKNIAPVHKSKLRKRVDFYFGPGGSRSAFWDAFGMPFGSLWDTLGDLGGPFWTPGGDLEVLWAAIGVSGVPLGPHFDRLWHLFALWAQKLSQGTEKTTFS